MRWEKSEDPEKDEVVYDVYFGQQGNLKLIASNLKALEYSIKDLETSKTYEWKVIAKNNYGAQAESKLQRFSTVSAGTLKWRFKTGREVYSSPAIGQDGTIYVGSWDGNLYAIASDSEGLANSPWPKFRGNLRNTGRFGISISPTTMV